MKEVIISNCVEIAASILLMLVSILGAWLTAKIGKRQELANINQALWALETATQQTVLELKQTMVDGLKAAAADNKLTADEIQLLNHELLRRTKALMSDSFIKLLDGAGVDINSFILSAGEAFIAQLKQQR